MRAAGVIPPVPLLKPEIKSHRCIDFPIDMGRQIESKTGRLGTRGRLMCREIYPANGAARGWRNARGPGNYFLALQSLPLVQSGVVEPTASSSVAMSLPAEIK